MIEHKSVKGSISLESGQYSNENMYLLYFNYYGKMCNLFSPDYNAEKNPDVPRMAKFIEKKFTFTKYVQENGSQRNTFYFFDNDKMIKLIEDKLSKTSAYILTYDGEFPKRFVDALASLYTIKEKHKKNIGVIVQEASGFSVYYAPLDRCDFIEENYNEDLVSNHPKIISELNSGKNGVHLFYGVPGTGKTSYISTLTNLVEKNLIYVPNSLAAQLDSPQFLKLLMNNTNSIFIIEDAEKIITSREKNANSPIAALLNLSDGLLGQSLKCQFICTFNTNLDNVDIALLRRGRLLSSYEFRPLEKERAVTLAKKLGKEYKEGENTITYIYNAEEIKNSVVNKIRQTIGFKVA